MALSQAKLAGELSRFMDPEHPSFAWPASRSEAIQLWVDAYDTYATDAEDVSGDAVVTKYPAMFHAELVNRLTGSWSSAAAALAFRYAFVTYWTGAVFAIGAVPAPGGPCPNVGGNGIFSVEIQSVVTSVNGVNLRSALLALFDALTDDAGARIEAIAAAFHAATTTDVLVTITGLDTTPPPAGPLPITNVCRVF